MKIFLLSLKTLTKTKICTFSLGILLVATGKKSLFVSILFQKQCNLFVFCLASEMHLDLALEREENKARQGEQKSSIHD
jgi:hypothetical protein